MRGFGTRNVANNFSKYSVPSCNTCERHQRHRLLSNQSSHLYYDILSDFDDAFGFTGPRAIKMLGRFPTTLEQLGEFEQEEVLYKRVFVALAKLHGRYSFLTIGAQVQLANISQQCQHFDKAEALFNEALTSTKTRLGYKHPKSIKLISSMATLAGTNGNYKSAEKQYLEVPCRKKCFVLSIVRL